MDKFPLTYNKAEVESQVAQILATNSTQISKKEALRLVLNCIDLTTLEGTDNPKKIEEVCRTARQFKNNGTDIPNVAAVCFYPVFVAQAKALLQGTGIKVAAVAGAFPSGQSPLDLRVAEVTYAVAQGADEIDMVISRGKYLENDYDFIHNEIKSIKKACGKAHLKVILETGELPNYQAIRHASELAINAGADFIKTSTGKIPGAATPEAFYVMLLSIKDHYQRTGEKIGIKPAGGIRTATEALKYVTLLEYVLGEAWMSNQYFRIGASSLAMNVLEQILTKE
ncbi:MAG: deoxyribose-phosphate aldolase [Bacteroidales bacterium]|nr:deoxyribose-phosphate aldolase [Bacteroidales bacterium]